MSSFFRRALQALLLLQALAEGAFISYDNCLAPGIVNSNPLQLQFIPLFLNAVFNESAPSHNLNITVYGNVSGQAVQGPYPAFDDPSWNNTNETFGKIVDIGTADKYATLLADFDLLTYSAYNMDPTEFCPSLINASCPLGPVWPQYGYANASDPYTLPAFSVAHDFYSSYAFGTLSSTIRIISGDTGAPDLACVSANITPDLGPRISGLLTWLPAAVLILSGISTVAAAIWSPWGSSDIFKWSSNYGRDEDLLRLVTPGFGDVLGYIQFVVLTGSLSLVYPGFYQPAVSQTSWANLQFNESFVSHGNGTQSLMDGIYTYNGTYGLTRMSQLVGMTATEDMWACMAIWLLVICAAVVALCQLGFFGRWIYRKATDTQEEDLRQKNWPFTAGNVIRIVFNFFFLPIVSLSMYQLVVAPHSPTSVVVMAVILLVAVIAFAVWMLRMIFTTKPRSLLFDDIQTVLLYGPLYNTYTDQAAPFAIIPVFITFMRGVAIGAVQPSGIAQLIILAICEVILILTMNAFKPFHGPTSMNLWHTILSVIRLITILLSVAFVPSLGVNEASKGWIGYAILLCHACVLVFGFFLNSLQTIIEVIARMCGVGGHSQYGAQRGPLPIFNIRQLGRRQDRPAGDRASMTSNAAILQDTDARSAYAGGRSRSLSASSQQLLNQHTPSIHRLSGFENFSSTGGENLASPAAMAEGETPFSYLPGSTNAGADANLGKPVLGVKTEGQTPAPDAFYRPPRTRRHTGDPFTPAARSRQSGNSAEFPYEDSPQASAGAKDSRDSTNPPSFPLRDSPSPAYFRDGHERSNSDLQHPSQTDYTTREVDQYYNFRGPALSSLPTRKLKTGPADPEGPAAATMGFFTSFFKPKKNKTSKGFEVVRSSRLPPDMMQEQEGHELQPTSPPMDVEPYHDSPDPQSTAGAKDGFFGPGPIGAAVDNSLQELERRGSKMEPRDKPPPPESLQSRRESADEPFDYELVEELNRSRESRQDEYPAGYAGTSANASGSQAQGSFNKETGAGHVPIKVDIPVHPALRANQPQLDRIDTTTESNYSPVSPTSYTQPSPLDTVGRPSSSYTSHYTRPSYENRSTYRQSADVAPSLAPIQSVGSIDMPSRIGSRKSVAQLEHGGDALYEPEVRPAWLQDTDRLRWDHGNSSVGNPSIPRRSSRRAESREISPSPNLAIPSTNERPASTGYVNTHLTNDQMRTNTMGASVQPSAAEWIGRRDSVEN